MDPSFSGCDIAFFPKSFFLVPGLFVSAFVCRDQFSKEIALVGAIFSDYICLDR
jgi:hypothetical protein